MHKIAVIGSRRPTESSNVGSRKQANATCTVDFPTAVRTGDLGSSRVYADPAKGVAPFDGIVPAAGNGITVVHGNRHATPRTPISSWSSPG